MQTSAHICILGGGFGGLSTARRLARRLRQCQITLVDPKPNFVFTPLLYEQFTGELETWEIAPTYGSLLPPQVEFRLDSVQRLDLQRRQVELQSGQVLSYDYLVLAVGQQTRAVTTPGADADALSFRSLADSDRLTQRLQALNSNPPQIAIVGSGANGVELACKLVDAYQAQIHLIDQSNTILKGFPVAVQTSAYRALARRTIDLKLETQVEAVGADWIQIRSLQVQPLPSVTLPIDLVVWTTGTQPWNWVRSLPCQQTPQGQLRLRPTLQLLDYPEVFAVGDVAYASDRHGQRLSPTAQVGVQQAVTVAENLCARINRQPLRSFHYRHQGDMLTLGIGEAVVSSPRLHLTGRIAHWLRQGVYLLRLPTWKHRRRVLWQRLRSLGRSSRGRSLQSLPTAGRCSEDASLPPSSQTRPSTRQ